MPDFPLSNQSGLEMPPFSVVLCWSEPFRFSTVQEPMYCHDHYSSIWYKGFIFFFRVRVLGSFNPVRLWTVELSFLREENTKNCWFINVMLLLLGHCTPLVEC
jgi:hypothetical protein